MPLPRPTAPLHKNDVLAANLLFLVLLLWLGERVSAWVVSSLYGSRFHLPVTNSWQARLPMVLVFACVKAGFYYAIRRGIRWAKMVVAVACLGLAYTNTIWHEGYVAGLNFKALPFYSLLVLLKNLLVLAALVLMFKKPRVAPGSISYV